ncbi:TPA: plasmid mobilization relaxosome protein MobC [Enterococcus faecalis]|uniref:Plasmid mobilization relaxosome protein MobC n=2 Tax=Enterococcus faecalis TaxID=1351 RepID=A0A1W6QWE7_ENTFL|nr:plasmid mobilization relaxosome protein MobC [Enterococcus faecalis]
MQEKKYKLKRPVQKIVRFSQQENEYLKKRIDKSPFNNFQNYARILCLTGEIKLTDYSELYRLNSELNRIGNNVNQLARLAHQFDEISNEDVHQLLEMMQEVKTIVTEKLKEELGKERTM